MIGQARQPTCFTRSSAAIFSPLICGALRSVPAEKLCTGSTPRPAAVRTMLAVPSSGKVPPVIGWSSRNFVFSFWKALKASLSAMGTLFLPLAMIALRFLLPITAPVPQRPAIRSSLTIPAKRTLFSPAGPITALP